MAAKKSKSPAKKMTMAQNKKKKTSNETVDDFEKDLKEALGGEDDILKEIEK
jgi:hypothetical protein